MAIIQTIPLGKKHGSMSSSEAQAGTNTESQLISAKVLNDQIDEKISDIGLATVATSGSYNDLNDKPTIPTIPAVNNGTLTIQKNGTTVKTFTANSSSNVTADITVPTKVSELTNDSGYITGVSCNNVSGKPSTFTPKTHTHAKSDITDFPTLATVATSGSYTDLANKPTIPTVNNGTLTIQKNGTTVKTFTANSSSNVTADITVPTKNSQLSNDTNYATTTNVANTYATKSENALKANDADVVHLTGDETIGGNKIFNNDIIFKSTLFSNKVEAPLVIATTDLGLGLV